MKVEKLCNAPKIPSFCHINMPVSIYLFKTHSVYWWNLYQNCGLVQEWPEGCQEGFEVKSNYNRMLIYYRWFEGVNIVVVETLYISA